MSKAFLTRRFAAVFAIRKRQKISNVFSARSAVRQIAEKNIRKLITQPLRADARKSASVPKVIQTEPRPIALVQANTSIIDKRRSVSGDHVLYRLRDPLI